MDFYSDLADADVVGDLLVERPVTTKAIGSRSEAVKELTARPVTSPRLRGEVGIRAVARIPGEGQSPVHNVCVSANQEQAPHPNPLPASGAREWPEGFDHASTRFFHTLSLGVSASKRSPGAAIAFSFSSHAHRS
jgi:hypothetical protein